jgi:hypothetical protein
MDWQRAVLTVAAAALMAVSFTRSDASARVRLKVMKRTHIPEALAPFDFCGGRLPGYGLDACGFREVSYRSCWRRLPDEPDHPGPRQVSVCGSSTALE